MKKLDTYLNLATQVYDLSKPNPPEDAYIFYRNYVLQAKGPVLEPMCGTGRFLLPFLAEGFPVHGFDASDHMLAALHAKAHDSNLKPNVWKEFIEDLRRPEQYNLIYIPSGSFCLITDTESVISTLKIFYQTLSDDGVLLFESETPNSVPQTGIWRGSVWHKPDDHLIILSQLANMYGNICHSVCKYELVHRDKIIHTEIEELKVRIYEREELRDILASCGFKNIRMIKAFDNTASPDNKDETIVYECRK